MFNLGPDSPEQLITSPGQEDNRLYNPFFTPSITTDDTLLRDELLKALNASFHHANNMELEILY